MKDYRSIREHRSPLPTPPYASEAADDLDKNLGVLDEEAIARINAYLEKQHTPYINPNNALNKIQRRLATIGLTFTFPPKRPYIKENNGISISNESFPISYFGGRTGVLDNNYTIGTDDNIRWRTGYGIKLNVSYSMSGGGGAVMVLPRLEMVNNVSESLNNRSREENIRRAQIKVDKSRKKLKSQFAKYGNRSNMRRDNIEGSLSDLGSDYRCVSAVYKKSVCWPNDVCSKEFA